MALFKCKMCGGDLEVKDGVTVAECEYCGTKQTLPKGIDDNLQSFYNRANALRIKSEFDKAEKIYEKIIEKDPTESEAYWGLILCRYGIEYVDDPETMKKIPTCHRASYDSIIADEDYKQALLNADIQQRAVYEAEAREIDRIQKEILALAQNEDSYDVFICYKETDSDGKRTQDSVIANDIYYQLKNEGFKVFYAAITLEGKLGSAYEPIIFAALNSAKVMLAIGTKPEYFNAVWVKNEWSRFLKIIKRDRTKLLIPCYRNMDAYELPEEFAHLQAQDMSKIGFISDIVRGIKRVVKREDTEQESVHTQASAPNYNQPASNIDTLLKRAFIFIEDGDFARADNFCEQVLNQDPENARAYLGKLMIGMKAHNMEQLAESSNIADNYNFKRVMLYGDEQTKSELERIQKISCAKTCARARIIMAEGTQRRYRQAADMLSKISDYEEARRLIEICNSKIDGISFEKTYKEAINFMKLNTIVGYHKAVTLFSKITTYKDSAELMAKSTETMNELVKENIYNRALSFMQEKSVEAQKSARDHLVKINGYKNSAELIKICEADIKYYTAKSNLKKGNYELAGRQFASLGNWRDSAKLAERTKTAHSRDVTTRIAIACGAILLAVGGISVAAIGALMLLIIGLF